MIIQAIGLQGQSDQTSFEKNIQSFNDFNHDFNHFYEDYVVEKKKRLIEKFFFLFVLESTGFLTQVTFTGNTCESLRHYS